MLIAVHTHSVDRRPAFSQGGPHRRDTLVLVGRLLRREQPHLSSPMFGPRRPHLRRHPQNRLSLKCARFNASTAWVITSPSTSGHQSGISALPRPVSHLPQSCPKPTRPCPAQRTRPAARHPHCRPRPQWSVDINPSRHRPLPGSCEVSSSTDGTPSRVRRS